MGGFKPNMTSRNPNWVSVYNALRSIAQYLRVQISAYNVLNSIATIRLTLQALSGAEFPGRLLSFINPDPGGLDEINQWLEHNKAIIAGCIVAVVLIIAGIVGFMSVTVQSCGWTLS